MAVSLPPDRIRSGSPFSELLGEFLGKPFVAGATGPDAYDCYGLCRAFMGRLGVELPDLGTTSIEQAPNLYQQAAPQFVRLDWPRPWSLISLRQGGELATHCGIVLPADGLFLHAQEKSGVVAEPIGHRYWHPRIEGYYWPRGVVEMVVLHSPLGPDHSWAFFREGASIAQMLDVTVAERVSLRVFLNGQEIERGRWADTYPTALQQVVVRPQYGDGRQALMAVGMIALAVVGGWVAGPAVLGLEGAAYGAALAGVMVGGSYLFNALIPPKKPEKEEGSYGWNPTTTQREGSPIPRLYGRVPVKGNIIMAYGDVSNTTGSYGTLSYAVYGYTNPVIVPITVSHPTTQASDYTWNVKLAYGDGPVQGVVAGSEKINGKPLDYYTGLAVEHKNGTDKQTATAMGDRTHYEPRLQCAYGDPQVYTFPDADIDRLAVVVGFPSGLIHYSSGGDASHRQVGIKVEIRAAGSGEPGWQTLVDTTENAKTTKWIHFAYYSDRTYTGGCPVTINRGTQYEVRLTRTSEDGGANSRDEMYLEALQGIYDDGFTYPGLAYSAISALASEKLSGSLEWEAVMEGRILNVYNGSSWVLQYSNNPAWVLVDLLTRPVINGDGAAAPYSVEYYRGIDLSWIDANAFKALADYCDEMVDDGKGGTEKRFVFNGILESEEQAWQVALRVADMCRAWPYFNGRQVTVAIDKAATPVQAFTAGNIISGRFDETWFDEEDRISEINYTILDEDQDYRRTPIRIVDSKVGRRAPVSADGWGITSQSQAYRTAIHKLTVNRLLPRSIELPADLDAIYCTIGQVIYVQHPIMHVNQGGRVTAVDGNQITVDFTPPDDGSSTYQIVVRTADETDGENLQLYTVANVSGCGITISLADWVYVPQVNDIVVYGTTTQINDLYRIRNMRRTQDAEVTLFCTAYDENYYGPDALTPVIATQQTVTAAATDRNLHRRPLSRSDLDDLLPQDRVAASLNGEPRLASLTFSGNGTDTVSWAGSDIGNCGTIVYNGHVVWIQQDLTGTTDRFIYFDPAAADPTVLQHTNNWGDLVGQEYYVVCVNISGVAYPQPCLRVGYNATLIGIEEGADVTGDHPEDIVKTGATPPAPQEGLLYLNPDWCGQDCVAHWRMNDNADSTHVKDESPNGNHGTAQRNTSSLSTAGKVGTGFALNGSSDFITVPSAASINFGTGDFSGCMWVKTTHVTDHRLFCKRDVSSVGLDWLIKSNGDLILLIGDSTGYSIGTRTPPGWLFDGNWHFLGFTVDRDGNSYFYVDGAFLTAMSFTPHQGSIDTPVDLLLGVYRDGTSAKFYGTMDNAALFCRALTKDDFDALYDAGTGTEQIGLGSTRMLQRSDGTYWLLADSDSPTIPRAADEITESALRKWAAESGADITGSHQSATAASLSNHDADSLAESSNRKWAGESGADITSAHTAAAIANQGALATLNTVGTAQVVAHAISQIVSAYSGGGTPIGTLLSTEQSAAITTAGGEVIIFWGAAVDYIGAQVGVMLRLYHESTLKVPIGEIWTVAGEQKFFFGFYQEQPAAAAHTYYLKAQVTSYDAIDMASVLGIGSSGRLALSSAAPHGLVGTGIPVQITGLTGVSGSPDLNGAHTVDVYDATTVKVNGTDGTNYSGSYGGGGTFWQELQAYLSKMTLVVMELKR
jgi:hypothetical protein